MLQNNNHPNNVRLFCTPTKLLLIICACSTQCILYYSLMRGQLHSFSLIESFLRTCIHYIWSDKDFQTELKNVKHKQYRVCVLGYK